MGGGVGSVLAPEIQRHKDFRISGPVQGASSQKPFQTKLDMFRQDPIPLCNRKKERNGRLVISMTIFKDLFEV